MNDESRISPNAISESLQWLNRNNETETIHSYTVSGTTSATTSIPPSTALSVTSYDTSETSGGEDDDIHLGLPPVFIIRQTKDRGLSLFSTRRISAGSLIFDETPLISLTKKLENDYDAVEAAFKSLSKPDRKAYLALFNAEKSRMSNVVSIYYSNCYNKDSFAEEGGSYVSPLASRINHSCVPNATFSYVPSSGEHLTGQIRFHAIKNIPANKEILSCYEKNIFLTREQRQRRLLLDYGFKCDCEACVPKSAFWAKSDERRSAMAECVRISKRCEKEWDETRSNPGADVRRDSLRAMAVETLTKLEALLLKEGLVYTPLANTYRSLAKWSQRRHEGHDVRKWKQKELELCVTCFGNDAARSKGLREDLELQQVP